MGTAGAIIAFILLFPSLVGAACHLYIVPRVGTGTGGDPFQPKYVGNAGVTWGGILYGVEGIYLVAADVSGAQDTAATAQSDVIRLPDNLDSTIGAQLTTVQNKLEAVNIPSGWITGGMTYRAVLRTIINMMGFFQRFSSVNKVYSAFVSGGVTLDTTFNSLSKTNQQRLINTAKSLNLDTSGLSGNTTLRQILKGIADQAQDRPITIGCLTI